MTSSSGPSPSEDSGNTGEPGPAGDVLFRSGYVLDSGYRTRLRRAILATNFIETRSLWQPMATVAAFFVATLIAYLIVGSPALPYLIFVSAGTAYALVLQPMYSFLKMRWTPVQTALVEGASYRAAFAHDRFQVNNPAGQRVVFRYSSFTGLKMRLGFVFLYRADRQPLILPGQLFTSSNLAWLEDRIREAQLELKQ